MRVIPNLQEILYRLVRTGVREANQLAASGDSAPGRFPVTVKPATRAFLEAEADALNTSIAGLAGAILDAVAQNTTGEEAGALALRSVADRLLLLLREHALSMPAAAEALEPYGVGLAELRSSEKLEMALTARKLKLLADLFSVNYDWLVGKSDSPGFTHAHTWYKNSANGALRAMRYAAAGWEVEVSLLRREGDDFERASRDDHPNGPEFIPALVRSKTLECGEELTCYEVWELGYWSYWKARAFAKIMVHFLSVHPSASAALFRVRITGRTLSRDEFAALKGERVIPATILRRPRRIDWYPDDYVTLGSPASKDSGEWRAIFEGEEFGSEARSFQTALSELNPKGSA